MIEFLQQLINGLSLGSIYALIALGYTMVYGVLRFINFAHGEVCMLGAFAGYFIAPELLPVFGSEPTIAGGIAVLLSAMLVCAVIGVLIEKVAYRPLRERPKLTVLITAIGVSLFLQSMGQYHVGADPKSFPEIIPFALIEKWDLIITSNELVIFGVTIVLMAVLTFIVLRTKVGMAMRAASFNPVAASLMGINNDRIISFTFAIGSALAGAAGVLSSMQQPSIDPLMGVLPGLKAFVAAVIGGIGNIPGAVLGGFLLGIIETLVVGYSEQLHISPAYKDAIAFAILIIILLFKPAGILGKVQREKV